MSNITRSSFLKRSDAAAAAFSIVPGTILGKSHGYVAPSDKLNIAGVGIGGMGNANLKNMEKTENIVALCDIDWKYAKPVFDRHPNAKKYWDYRKMLDSVEEPQIGDSFTRIPQIKYGLSYENVSSIN